MIKPIGTGTKWIKAGTAMIPLAICASLMGSQSSSTPIRRPPADAGELRNELNLPTGRPTIIWFMDFQCPTCRKNWPSLRSYLKKHRGVEFRAVNYPLRNHKQAFPTAVAVEIARSKGFYDQAVDDLMSEPESLDTPQLNAYLKRHHAPPIVDTSRAAEYEAKVRASIALGRAIHVNKTPTLLVFSPNGQLTEVNSVSELDVATK